LEERRRKEDKDLRKTKSNTAKRWKEQKKVKRD
jgi:hypothetical protein